MNKRAVVAFEVGELVAVAFSADCAMFPGNQRVDQTKAIGRISADGDLFIFQIPDGARKGTRNGNQPRRHSISPGASV
jgi:hypothetical protein